MVGLNFMGNTHAYGNSNVIDRLIELLDRHQSKIVYQTWKALYIWACRVAHGSIIEL